MWGSKLLRPSPAHPPPDMVPFFLKQYVRSHASNVFEAYPQLLTEMALMRRSQRLVKNPALTSTRPGFTCYASSWWLLKLPSSRGQYPLWSLTSHHPDILLSSGKCGSCCCWSAALRTSTASWGTSTPSRPGSRWPAPVSCFPCWLFPSPPGLGEVHPGGLPHHCLQGLHPEQLPARPGQDQPESRGRCHQHQ